MKKLLSLMALALLATVAQAQAGELDNEEQVKNAARFAVELPQTLVVRQDSAGNTTVFHSADKLAAGVALDTTKAKFEAITRTAPPSELDRDSSASGWYFWWNYQYSYNYGYSYYPSYYYYNYQYSYSYSYSYQPYYSYYSPYDNCNYWYYGWRW